MSRFPQTWTLATSGHCHICRTNTPQVEYHKLLNGGETIERRCQDCGQVTWRQHRPAWDLARVSNLSDIPRGIVDAHL